MPRCRPRPWSRAGPSGPETDRCRRQYCRPAPRRVWPGLLRHARALPDAAGSVHGQPAGAGQVLGAAGDVVDGARRLWRPLPTTIRPLAAATTAATTAATAAAAAATAGGFFRLLLRPGQRLTDPLR